MNENQERAKGKLQEFGGTLKEKAGELTGNERMEAEGHADQVEGQGRQEFAKGVGQAKGAGEELKGNLKEGFGKLTGDDSTRAEGEVDQVKGQARQEFNR